MRFSSSMSTVASIPFSAIVKFIFEQKLPDGNVIHFVAHTHEARDSSGRSMTETALGCARGGDGQMHEQFIVSVHDPVARINMAWGVGDNGLPKTVSLYHQPDPPPQPPVIRRQEPPDPVELARQLKMRQASQQQQLQVRRENQTEDLGTRDFFGIAAQGTRNTRTIPPGEEGNDRPLVVLTEVWKSKELGLTFLVISDDPRSGRTTTECEALDRGEPNPSLFTPPAGYKVVDRTWQMVVPTNGN